MPSPRSITRVPNRVATLLCLLFLASHAAVAENGDPSYPPNLIANPGFELAGENRARDWQYYGRELGGTLRRPIDSGWRHDEIVVMTANGGVRALFQDVGPLPVTDDDGNQNVFTFECFVRGGPGTRIYLVTHDTKEGDVRGSKQLVPDGRWQRLRIRGMVPDTGMVRVHLWLNEGEAEAMMPRFIVTPSTLAPSDTAPGAPHEDLGVEAVIWDGWDGRLALQSRKTGIALTFGREDIREGGFLMNIMTDDQTDLADYMCLPDDIIIAYNADGSSAFTTRSHALRWNLDYGPKSRVVFHETGYLEYRFGPMQGWNNADPIDKQIWQNYTVPPLEIRVRHELHHAEKWVPMIVEATNRFEEPLRVHYLIQDGAWMTDFAAGHQENVHQYWPDGEHGLERAVVFTPQQRAQKQAWGTIYNDQGGGMSATLYLPPDTPGDLAWMAAWDGEEGHTYIDTYTHNSERWYTPDGMLRHLGFEGEPDAYDSTRLRIRGALIDLGVIRPGETASAVIVKIFDRGYADRGDMELRIRGVIDSIPPYAEPWLHGTD